VVGATEIASKYRCPAWSSPEDIKRERPNLPDFIPGGSPQNPPGVAAMTLAGSESTIHAHQHAEFGRRLCLLWLHPHAQQRVYGPV